MREGWREVRLKDVATQNVKPFTVDPDTTYVNLGVQWYAGGTFAREPKLGSEMKAARLFEVRPGQFIYNRMFVTEGSFALVAQEHSGGVVSNEFPVFDLDESTVLPSYLLLHFQQPSVWRDIADQATGTTKSRRRWKEGQFLEYSITLPPLAEQRRIVDLIAAVDDAIAAAEGEAGSAAKLLNAVLDAADDAADISIGSVATISSGASWAKVDVRPPDDGGDPVLTITNTKPDGTVAGDPTYVAGLSAKTGRLTPSSIVAIRTNGNHDRIGNVYRVPDEYLGAAVSAFQLILEPLIPEDCAYLYWMMRRPGFQSEVTRAASGSTGLGNIAASKLRAMAIPWPKETNDRTEQVATYEALVSNQNTARTHAESLRTLRSNLLTVLLSGEHEIPATYDDLLSNEDVITAA
ncbi:restriction endonuclease subunit S [Microbacterium esteraromaticum]|uniref:restriction endonuclease subunit S n=1 Tax=Microbacterium esteraromaticum TaxID=57043 RepID=UPI0023686355|nr:restriction endonuclease subunit S [Microbacterium esteraromaticum]WDH78216.1 restriction endonuclease subunit S [Microbacterium esteraromaticum]